MIFPPTEPPFVAAMLTALAEHGPLTPGALAARIGEPEPLVAEELRCRGDVHETKQGWYSVGQLADGATLTHRLTAEELTLGVLVGDGDLDLWARLADQGIAYAGGGVVHGRSRLFATLPAGATMGLTGPADWLAGRHEHDLVALRLQDGVLALTLLQALPEPDADRVAVLVECAQAAAEATLLEEPEEGPGAPLAEVVLAALVRAPDLLVRPLPPLGLLLTSQNLELRGDLVGLPGSDWDGIGFTTEGMDASDLTWAAELRAVRAVLDPEQTPSPTALRATLDLLSTDGPQLHLLTTDVTVTPERDARLQVLAGAAESPSQHAVAAYLLAGVAERAGQVLDAQEHLDTALSLLPDYVSALLLAADFAANRGDARAADQLYERAGVAEDSPWRRALTEFLQPAPATVGRNKPCPCGSGRKYKACCGPNEPLPLPLRARWRYTRAVLWALLPEHRGLLLTLAESLAGPAASEPDIQDALADPVVTNLALFEAGLLATYLHQRGPLMPPDERALVQSWLTRPLELWEVQSTRPGFDLTLRALPDGGPVTVRGQLLSSELERTDLLLARLLSDGESLQFLSPPTWIPPTERTHLTAALGAGDPYDLLAALDPGPLPELVNTEDEPVVMCTARFRVPTGTWQALARDLEDDNGELIELVTLKGHLVQRGRVRQVDGGLELSANSVERIAGLTQRLLAVAPGAMLLEQAEVPAAELMTSGSGLPGGLALPPGQPGPLPTEVLAELSALAEQRWLTESIPALDGMTPRAAADDPLLRPRLLALLDGFSWQEGNSSLPALLQADRLRAALGLTG